MVATHNPRGFLARQGALARSRSGELRGTGGHIRRQAGSALRAPGSP
jgi:hypothetical protein